MTGEVKMWESELTGGGELPMVCVVTGADAVTWISGFPVCAGVRLQARLAGLRPWCTGIAALAWPASFAGMAILAGHYGLGGQDGSLLRGLLVIPVMFATILAALAIMAAAMTVREMLEVPVPEAAQGGFNGGERWFVVRPVHPRFAAAVNGLSRPRPR